MRSWSWSGLLVAAGLAATPALAKDEVQVFDLPAGAHPHDAAPAPDGRIWYTAQAQGALGILDPSTGAVEQVPLGDGSAPHGVIQGPDGKAWVTDGGQNAIVSFDPGSRKVSVFALPDEVGYANLNTAAFDGAGILWFTGQSGIYGRLDPGSGEIQVFDAPKGRGPYGITATPAGEIYFASLAGSYVGHVDPKTGEVSVIEPPTPGQGARRVWSDSKGRIWVSEWNAGQVSRYTPSTGAWRSWRSLAALLLVAALGACQFLPGGQSPGVTPPPSPVETLPVPSPLPTGDLLSPEPPPIVSPD